MGKKRSKIKRRKLKLSQYEAYERARIQKKPGKKTGNPGHHSSHHYPRHRRTPIRHKVNAHTRDGHHVDSYQRGKGVRTQTASTSRRGQIRRAQQTGRMKETLNSPPHEPRLYTVVFKYEDKTKETVKTTARSPRQALRFADTQRTRQDERPTEVVVKNQLGKVIGTIAGYAVKGIRGGIRTYREAQEAYRNIRDARLNDLIKRSYSTNSAERLKARAQMRKEYPEIYQELHLDTPPIVQVKPNSPRVVEEPEREPPVLKKRRREASKLRKTMKRKKMSPPKKVTRKKAESAEEYEQRLFRQIQWMQAAIEKEDKKAPKAKERPLEVEIR